MPRSKWVVSAVPSAIALVILGCVYARGWLPPVQASSVAAAVLPGCLVLLLLTRAVRPAAPADGIALVAWGALCCAYPLSVSGVSDRFLMSAFGVDEVLASKLSTAVVAPMLEEAVKALGVLWAFAFLPRRSWSAGFFYAGLIGVGFAMFETTTYYDRLGLSWELVQSRLPSAIRHSAYTACFAMALGALWAQASWVRWVGCVGSWMGGVIFHAGTNTPTPAGQISSALLVVAGWLAIWFVIFRHERKSKGDTAAEL